MEKTQEPKCPYCGNEMILMPISIRSTPDIQNQYFCAHCGADAPLGTSPEDAREKALRLMSA